MNNSPQVSVLMSVYNAERYVAETIESILTQTFTDFEFIVIDDGSSDRSPEILKAYAAKDQRIRFISRLNKGLTPTMNEMLALAQGEFIAIIENDDIAFLDRFSRQLEFLRCHPEVVCVGGAQVLIDESGRLLTSLLLPEADVEIQKLALAGHCSICHPGAMIRRSAMIQVGGYDETMSMAHDLDLWLRLGEIGALANLKDAVIKYRLRTDSISGQNPIKQRKEAQAVCERAWKRRGIEGHFEAVAPWRPDKDGASRHHFMLQYGWWAFGSGQRQTAMIYALRAIRVQPLAIKGWKLLATAAVKKLPVSSSV